MCQSQEKKIDFRESKRNKKKINLQLPESKATEIVKKRLKYTIQYKGFILEDMWCLHINAVSD